MGWRMGGGVEREGRREDGVENGRRWGGKRGEEGGWGGEWEEVGWKERGGGRMGWRMGGGGVKREGRREDGVENGRRWGEKRGEEGGWGGEWEEKEGWEEEEGQKERGGEKRGSGNGKIPSTSVKGLTLKHTWMRLSYLRILVREWTCDSLVKYKRVLTCLFGLTTPFERRWSSL